MQKIGLVQVFPSGKLYGSRFQVILTPNNFPFIAHWVQLASITKRIINQMVIIIPHLFNRKLKRLTREIALTKSKDGQLQVDLQFLTLDILTLVYGERRGLNQWVKHFNGIKGNLYR